MQQRKVFTHDKYYVCLFLLGLYDLYDILSPPWNSGGNNVSFTLAESHSTLRAVGGFLMKHSSNCFQLGGGGCGGSFPQCFDDQEQNSLHLHLFF